MDKLLNALKEYLRTSVVADLGMAGVEVFDDIQAKTLLTKAKPGVGFIQIIPMGISEEPGDYANTKKRIFNIKCRFILKTDSPTKARDPLNPKNLYNTIDAIKTALVQNKNLGLDEDYGALRLKLEQDGREMFNEDLGLMASEIDLAYYRNEDWTGTRNNQPGITMPGNQFQPMVFA
jgi:hypothetical protein